MEDEGVLSVDLDELRQVLHRLLDVDERVAGVVEHTEEPVGADVDAGGLDQVLVERVDLDPALGELAADRSVGQDHGAILGAKRFLQAKYSVCSPAGLSAIVRLMATTRAIELRTALPGPRSTSILDRKERVIAAPLSLTFPIAVQEGQGALLTDVDGNTFIDFTGGVGCLNVGHSHPRVVAAAQEQLESFAHTDFTIVPYETYVTLAERLIELAPFTGPAKAAFFNAGTEAVENSIKFARAFTGRPAVIVFEGAFHGRTLLSMTMTSKTHPYKAGLGPFSPEVYRVPFANDYRGPDAETALAALEKALITQVAAENVAAIVIEPVQGEGGFVVAPREFLTGVRRVCDDNGIVLVVDEVQTGFARTGKL